MPKRTVLCRPAPGEVGCEREPAKANQRTSGEDEPLRVFVLNCYLLPTAFTFNPIFWGCVRQNERAEAVANTVKDFDVACLQEVWGGGNHKFGDVQPSHAMRLTAIRCCGPLNPLVNFTRGWLYGHGGLLECWRRKDLKCFLAKKANFSKSVPLARQGASGVCLEARCWREGWLIIVFNCHFSILGGEKARLSNLRELVSFMQDFVNSVFQRRAVAGEDLERASRQCLVLLCGDFNVAAGSRIYKEHLLRLGGFGVARDAFPAQAGPTVVKHDRFKKRGNSFAYWNTTGKVDHIFSVEEIDFPGSRGRWTFAAVDFLSANVDTRPYGKEVSDHYGLSVCILPKELNVRGPLAVAGAHPLPPCDEKVWSPFSSKEDVCLLNDEASLPISTAISHCVAELSPALGSFAGSVSSFPGLLSPPVSLSNFNPALPNALPGTLPDVLLDPVCCSQPGSFLA